MTNTLNHCLTLTRETYDELTAQERADLLFGLDAELRDGISTEEVFERWLMCGVPDGCETVEDVMDAMDPDEMEWEAFEEYILLAKECFEIDSAEYDCDDDPFDY